MLIEFSVSEFGACYFILELLASVSGFGTFLLVASFRSFWKSFSSFFGSSPPLNYLLYTMSSRSIIAVDTLLTMRPLCSSNIF